MNIKTHYSLKDFKENYQIDYKEYIEVFNDCSEMQFVIENINHYKICLKNVTYLKSTSGHEHIETLLTGENFMKDVIDKITHKEYLEVYNTPRKRLEYTFLNILDYLKSLSIKTKNNESQNHVDFLNTNIKFNVSPTELIELTKSLIENGNVKGKQKDIINSFARFFNIEVNNPDKLITDIKKRNTGSETLFIDKLKSSLYDYMTKETKR
ncbi:RteC domain-containing protein [Gelidibacter sp.]|uniref:RteC domain-containing protein n=1 Tax=Gelidibacter sp. TaxID=2018083 RepID=UPI002BF42EFB|nr:RteC domain-containing protein [Gelidibacter sp.]HUH26867.1 RteC domain-containing protein [Gelidibacter sp.]